MATPPSFTAGSVLTAAQLNAAGLWRVTACTVTSAGGTAATASNGVITVGTNNTSVTVNNAFSSDFDSYLLAYTGGVGSSAAAGLRIAFNIDTANNYYSNGQYQTAGLAAINAVAFGAVTGQITIGYVDTGDFSCNMVINNPNKALNTTFWNQFTALGSASRVGFIAGWSIATGANTGFTLSPSAGNLTGGTIRVYGYRN